MRKHPERSLPCGRERFECFTVAASRCSLPELLNAPEAE